MCASSRVTSAQVAPPASQHRISEVKITQQQPCSQRGTCNLMLPATAQRTPSTNTCAHTLSLIKPCPTVSRVRVQEPAMQALLQLFTAPIWSPPPCAACPWRKDAAHLRGIPQPGRSWAPFWHTTLHTQGTQVNTPVTDRGTHIECLLWIDPFALTQVALHPAQHPCPIVAVWVQL